MKSIVNFLLSAVMALYSMFLLAQEPIIIAPKLMKAGEVSTPYTAQIRNLCGDVQVEYYVDTGGNVYDVKAIESSDPLFEDNAILAVTKSRFEPATRDGRAVKYGPTVMNIKFGVAGRCSYLDDLRIKTEVPLDELPDVQSLSANDCIVLSAQQGEKDSFSRVRETGGHFYAVNQCLYPVEFSMCITGERKSKCKILKRLDSGKKTIVARNVRPDDNLGYRHVGVACDVSGRKPDTGVKGYKVSLKMIDKNPESLKGTCVIKDLGMK